MSSSGYLALYRRYRPQRFADVAGQEAVVASLLAALRSDRTPHAYLFCGPRGTGKTSVARLLARAMNCERRREGEPCGECPPCRDSTSASAPDVFEIDAASNRNVESMRELVSQVGYSPTRCRFKVYILDEAHMLTKEAANTFLKTLEEPPPHVVFVLATTEAHKILPTISSRCQVYEFRKIGEATCRDLLVEVARAEGMELLPEAAALLAARSGGAMRDALGLLERLLSGGRAPIDRLQVSEALGMIPEEILADLAEGVAGRRSAAVYAALAEVEGRGRDVRRLLEDIVSVFRAVLRSSLGLAGALSAFGESVARRLEALGKELAETRLLSILSRLDRGQVEARQGLVASFAVELALLEACHLDVLWSRDELEVRLAALEARPPMEAALPAPAPARSASPGLPAAPVASSPPAPVRAVPPPTATPAPTPPSTPVPAAAPAPASSPAPIPPAAGPARPAAAPVAPAAPGSAAATKDSAPTQVSHPAPSAPSAPAAPDAAAGALTAEAADDLWRRALEALRVDMPLHGVAREAKPSPGAEGSLELAFAHSFHYGRVTTPANRAKIETLVAEVAGRPLPVRIVQSGDAASPGTPGAAARKPKRGKDWFENRVLENDTVKGVVEALDGKVLRID